MAVRSVVFVVADGIGQLSGRGRAGGAGTVYAASTGFKMPFCFAWEVGGGGRRTSAGDAAHRITIPFGWTMVMGVCGGGTWVGDAAHSVAMRTGFELVSGGRGSTTWLGDAAHSVAAAKGAAKRVWVALPCTAGVARAHSCVHQDTAHARRLLLTRS